MTTPTLFSDVAANAYQAKVDRSGAVRTQKATVTVPASTASGTNIGVIRFQKGWNLAGFQVVSTDLDTGTSVTLDVGYLYDDSTTYTEDPNAFLSAADIAQDAGSRVWPIADGLTPAGFVAEADGYLSITTGGGSTTTAGTITVNAIFSYDA